MWVTNHTWWVVWPMWPVTHDPCHICTKLDYYHKLLCWIATTPVSRFVYFTCCNNKWKGHNMHLLFLHLQAFFLGQKCDKYGLVKFLPQKAPLTVPFDPRLLINLINPWHVIVVLGSSGLLCRPPSSWKVLKELNLQ